MTDDFLDELIVEGTKKDPKFADMVEKAYQRRLRKRMRERAKSESDKTFPESKGKDDPISGERKRHDV